MYDPRYYHYDQEDEDIDDLYDDYYYYPMNDSLGSYDLDDKYDFYEED